MSGVTFNQGGFKELIQLIVLRRKTEEGEYTRTRKLTQRMLSALIDHIEVYQAEKMDGVHVQKLKIHYNCVDPFEIPDVLPLPEPDILMQTRKGAALSYPAQKAV